MKRVPVCWNALPLAVLALSVACETPTIPGRDGSDIYPFDLPVTPSAVMRWAVGSTIRVHVVEARTAEATQRLRSALEAGAAAWNESALFAEFSIVPAASESDADVVLAFSDVLLPVDTQGCRPALTLAVTTFCIDDLGSPAAAVRVFPLLSGAQSRVRMIVLVLGSVSADAAVVDRLVAHELGHVIGIGRHSDDTRDLMYRSDQVTARPTSRDAATAQVLYHVRADIEIR
jgi:predicted Zn-dependent protease